MPYLRQSTQNLRFHQPVEVVALKAMSGISVRASLQIDERNHEINPEIKNILDYKVGHYVHHHDITDEQKQNVLHQAKGLSKWTARQPDSATCR